MILAFRISLLVLGGLFAYLFGETSEKFFLEVLRFFISLNESNALLFNAAHIAVSVIPLFLFGLIMSISTSGERDLRRRAWFLILGGVSSLAAASFEEENILAYAVLCAAGSFFWVLITHKIQGLSGPIQMLQGLGITALSGLLVSFTVKKIKTF